MGAPLSLLPLHLEGVEFEVGARRIIQGVSATIDAGPPTVILGPNGAGKSVLLRLCHGLLGPTAGTIEWNSPELPGGPRRQAMVFQRPVLLRRTVLGNVMYALKLSGVARQQREERAREALRKVGLDSLASHAARVLSGGEQQRLALARVWALGPEILFLDEPTASLDPGATHEIENVILALHAAGTKIVLVTHNLGQAHRLGDEILFLHQGRLVERAPADRFLKHPGSPEAASFLEGELPW
jgi:tungstate transport system ATP-binding protein